MEGLKVVIAPRRGGKTTQLLDWVLAGKEVDGYPGWSRVLVVHSIEMERHLRRMIVEYSGLPWVDIDFTHRVYAWVEWKKAQGVHPDTEVMIDNVEFLLPRMPGHLEGFSVSGQIITGGLDSACKLDAIQTHTLVRPV